MNITVKCHQQDRVYYCGAASAQMVLDGMGKGLISQDRLYELGNSHDNALKWSPNLKSKWGMDPDGLAYLLNYYTMISRYVFSVYKDTDAYQLTCRIVSSLMENKIPVPVLTLGDVCHWLVVRGVKLMSLKRGYSMLLGLYINDPWPPCPSAYDVDIITPPPPHDGNDLCGSGGDIECNDRKYSYGAVCNSYISLRDMWLDTYMAGCDFTGTGVKESVSICPSIMQKWPSISMSEFIPPEREHIIDIGQIGEFVAAGLDKHGLYADEAFSHALKSVRPSGPMLVQRLDRPDSYYYMVPMKSKKAITAMTLADGLSGSLQGCTAFRSPVENHLLSREQALGRILDRTIDLGNKAGTIKFREGTFSFHPVLVWKPCRESLSPYYPFYMFTSGDKHVYVGYDGRIYTELHDKEPVG